MNETATVGPARAPRRTSRWRHGVGCVRGRHGAWTQALSVAALAIAAGSVTSAPGAAQKPLFASDSLIELRLEAPLRRMLRDKENNRQEGLLQLDDPGPPIPIKVTLRGKSRLASGICSFSGLMLYFDSLAVAGTVFDGQSMLPLTTHCKDRPDYEQYVLLEYLAYRAYELVSEMSLGVRLARIEYIDSERGQSLTTRYAFFVEHWDDLAARRGWVMVHAPAVPPSEYRPEDRNEFEVFQYLIGNTDWSYTSAEPDETFCCHNVVPIGNPAGPIFPVPFDFDQAGLVNAVYARPSSKLPITNVRQRLYRGICVDRQVLDSTVSDFQGIQSDMLALVRRMGGLTAKSQSDALEYVEAFYREIDDPRAVDRRFVKGCRGEPRGP